MFLLDTNVFIDASRRYYSPSIAPTFWTWLGEQHEQGRIASIRKVQDELDDGKTGHLKQWAASLPPSFWIKPDTTTQPSLARLATWVRDPSRQYLQAARDEFLRVADYLLVAQAHALGGTVVTFEQPAPQSRKRVMIPDACSAMSVAYREPFSVYRDLGLQFT